MYVPGGVHIEEAWQNISAPPNSYTQGELLHCDSPMV